MMDRSSSSPRTLLVIAGLVALAARSNGQDAADALREQYEAEQAAIQDITRLGGWVVSEKQGDFETVVEVNMVYRNTADRKRQENTNVSSDALEVVPTFVNLRRLLLKETQANDAALGHIRGMRHLEGIYLWDASLVTNRGVEHFTTLPALKYVHINESAISDEALLHFSRIETLEGLSLQQNSFTDEGMRHLTPLKNLKELYVGLGHNSVSDVGLEPLSKLENLETLDLQHSAITDDGLIYLVNLKKLRSLWLNGTRVTRPAAEMLQQAIPGLQVTF